MPEIVDLAAVEGSIVADAVYVEDRELYRIDANRILRYDLTLPPLLDVRCEERPLRIWAAGKTRASREFGAGWTC